MKLLRAIFVGILVGFFVQAGAEEKKELLFYIGITMVKPINELAENFKKMHNCDIKILQGGSQDLYDSLSSSKKGDLYMPGSITYRNKYLKDGLLQDAVFVGYNKASLVVQKGNPKNIQSDLNILTNPDYRVVLGNAESGSIGNETKKVLTLFGNYEEAMLNAVFLATDSRTLTKALKENEADVVINWYATVFWDGNSEFVEAIPIDEKYAKKAILTLNLLKSSKYPDLTKEFMKYASGKEGREVFKKYGFLDEEDMKNFDKVKL